MKKNEIISVSSVALGFVLVKIIGIENIPSQVNIFIFFITPLVALWMVLKYKKSKVQQKYTIITLMALFIFFYIGGIYWIMDKYFHHYFIEYNDIFLALFVSSFIITAIIAIVSKKLIDRDEALSKKNKR